MSEAQVLSIVDGLSILTCLAFLTYSSWSDVKTREVSDRVWLIFFPIALSLTSVRIVLCQKLFQVSILSVFLGLIVSAILLYSGFFGGADVKALICVTVSNPTPPAMVNPIAGFLHPFFPITLFCNSCLIALSSAAYMALRNLLRTSKGGRRLFGGFEEEPVWRKMLAFISGYKIDISELKKRKHLYPMEQVSGRNDKMMRRFRFFVDVEENQEKRVKELEGHVKKGLVPGEVWISPGLPMLVFFTLGYVLTVTLGDITFWLIKSLVQF